MAEPSSKQNVPKKSDKNRSKYRCRKCRAHGLELDVRCHKKNCEFKSCMCDACRLVDNGRQIVAKQISLYRDQKNSHKHVGVGQAQQQYHAAAATKSLLAAAVLNNGGLQAANTTHLPSSSKTAPAASVNKRGTDFQAQQHPDVKPGATAYNASVAVCRPMPTATANAGAAAAAAAVLDGEGPHCRRCRNHNKIVPWKGHKKTCEHKNCQCAQCILIEMRKSNEKRLREIVHEDDGGGNLGGAAAAAAAAAAATTMQQQHVVGCSVAAASMQAAAAAAGIHRGVGGGGASFAMPYPTSAYENGAVPPYFMNIPSQISPVPTPELKPNITWQQQQRSLPSQAYRAMNHTPWDNRLQMQHMNAGYHNHHANVLMDNRFYGSPESVNCSWPGIYTGNLPSCYKDMDIPFASHFDTLPSLRSNNIP